VLLYNAPKFTGGISLTPRAVGRLAAHPNIVGMKDSSDTGPAAILAELDTIRCEFTTLAGSANFLYPALHLGAVGGVVSLANPLPDDCCRLYRLFREEKYGQARELHHRLVRLNRAVSGSFGVAGVKAAMDLLGFRGGEPRSPLRSLTREERERLAASIVREGVEIEA
jgi:4-hydroxy-2-oxoglutarate aldolase